VTPLTGRISLILVNADIGIALGNVLGNCTAGNQFGLRLDLIGDAEPIEKLCHIDAARPARRGIDIGDRFCLEQRALERISVLMSGRGAPSLTTTPMPTLASCMRPAAAILPFRREIIDAPGLSTAMSNTSPCSMRLTSAPTVSLSITTLWPSASRTRARAQAEPA